MQQSRALARKWRPQCFSQVIGQEALVTTLLNALRLKRLAHAYLFCGSRGTGKTSIARIFAKALLCKEAGIEPCNQCPSCLEINAGCSLDLLEIDGATHRGIDDVRKICETVGFAPASGVYKIYLIDEVHMLTKEAFNALLKTLEEPPAHVLFFFATTEPHRVPPTILSRCQRFALKRIREEEIAAKLQVICKEEKREVEEPALFLLAKIADGSLRDAESLLDQLLAYKEGSVVQEDVTSLLGLVPSSFFAKLDEAVREHKLATAFEIVHTLFSEGKDLFHFADGLIEHFRSIVAQEMEGTTYTVEEALAIMHYLLQARLDMARAPLPSIFLEGILLHIIQTKKRLSIEALVERLSLLEKPLPQSSKGSPPAGKIAVSAKDETVMRFAAVELEGTLKRNG